jgi:hypothetical protein
MYICCMKECTMIKANEMNSIWTYSPTYIPAATAAWADLSIPVTLLLASSLSSGLN